MQLNRAQFDIATSGAYVVALVSAVLLVPAAILPVAVLGALVVGLAYAMKDAGDAR